MGIGIRRTYGTTADTVVTNSAALATISGFSIPVVAGQALQYTFRGSFTIGLTGGFRFDVVGGSGLTFTTHTGHVHIFSDANAYLHAFNVAGSSLFANAAAAAQTCGIEWSGYVLAATSGNLLVQVAQNTADALSLTLTSGAVFSMDLL